MKKLLISYFSGTGNTFRAINIIKEHLEKNGFEIDVLKIKENTTLPSKEYDEYLFAFPIYVFSPPLIVSRFIKMIGKSNNKTTSILITNAAMKKGAKGYCGYTPYYIKKILSKKGYEIKRVRDIGYPEYWTQMINPPTNDLCNMINNESDKAVVIFADAILKQHEIKIRKPNIYEILFFKYVIPFYKFFISKCLGKLFIADKRCISCKHCVKSCPTGAIKMSGKRPKWNNKCLACNRCINSCPQKAIQTSVIRLFIHVFLAIYIYYLGIVFSLNLISSIPYNFPTYLLLFLKIISSIVALIIMLKLQVTIYDYIIGLLEKIPFLRPLFELSFTKYYRRQKAEGFSSIER